MMNNKDLDDILNDPIFTLNDTEKELFHLPEAIKQGKIKKQQAEEIGRRKPCENFEDYAALFVQVHKDLKEGRRRLIGFKEDNLQEKVFFIADGVMGYVDQLDVDNRQIKDRVRKDGRSRVIFEDGTESNILFRTIGKNITKNGYIVTALNDGNELASLSGEQVTENDEAQGWIYILRSKSEDERIASVENLYKIGFTTTPVEQRISNAKNESTYLMADVEVINTYKVYNINVQKLEYLLHLFFAVARFHVKVGDAVPEEWFVVPLPIIRQAIARFVDGSIVNYRYNVELEALEEIVFDKNERVRTKKADISGLEVLTLTVKQVHFDFIFQGEQDIESRTLRATTINKLTRLDKATGKRYIRQPNVLRLYCGYSRDRDVMLVEVMKTEFEQPDFIMYHLGRVLEYDVKKTTAIRLGISEDNE